MLRLHDACTVLPNICSTKRLHTKKGEIHIKKLGIERQGRDIAAVTIYVSLQYCLYFDALEI